MNSRIKRDLKHNWHPYTQMKDCVENPPIFIERANGAKLYDDKGKFYYDTISSWWCNVHGHNHPTIAGAINKQLKKLDHVMFAGFMHENAIILSERLTKIAPKCLNRVFYSDNGSTAVETALKMSFQYWRNVGKRNKTKFISLDHGYHGDTIGTMSVGGVSLFNKVFSPLLFPSIKASSPYCYRCPVGKERRNCSIDCIKALEDILEKRHEEISALILEPMVMAAGGMIIYPKEYLAKAAGLAKKYGIHLIVDEVATGFGRTGKMFACEHADIQPDFMCLSKGITSGTLALGATLTTDEIYDAFYADYKDKKTFYHGHTFTANPIACAAAIANLEIFEKERTLATIEPKINHLRKQTVKFRDLPIVGAVRSLGMIAAFELVKDQKRKTPFNFEERVGLAIYKEGLKKNLILRPLGNITYLFLPLCVKNHEIEYILETTREILSQL